MTRTAIAANEKIEATETLLRLFPSGAMVHTIVRHVSQSGMQRAISVLAVDGDEIRDVSWIVAKAGLFSLHPKQSGLKVDGSGMDMTFHVAYSLAQMLHGDGYALGHRNI